MKDKIFKNIILGMCVVAIICAFCFIAIFLVSSIDQSTRQEVGTEKVPCIDKLNRPFENELCEKKIYCSKFGLVEDKCEVKE